MRRRYPKHPLLGIGALIFLKDEPKGPILMVERAGNPLKGYWSLPGGLVETGETLETAVKREVSGGDWTAGRTAQDGRAV